MEWFQDGSSPTYVNRKRLVEKEKMKLRLLLSDINITTAPGKNDDRIRPGRYAFVILPIDSHDEFNIRDGVT